MANEILNTMTGELIPASDIDELHDDIDYLIHEYSDSNISINELNKTLDTAEYVLSVNNELRNKTERHLAKLSRLVKRKDV